MNSYESKLKKLQNIQGGGSLVNGRTFDFRKVMEEIVKEYPMVHQQKEVYQAKPCVMEDVAHHL